jgi:hypothetical protein
MPLLSNPRHEAYAQGRANGLRVHDAYISAGFEGNPSAASQIENRPEVRSRVQEIIQEKQEKRRQIEAERGEEPISDIDHEWIVRELKRNVQKAQETGQISAANKGIELLMDVLNIGPKKARSSSDEEESAKDKKPAAPNDDKLGNVLDKINQMGGFDE